MDLQPHTSYLQTTHPAATGSQIVNTNQHTERLTKVFRSPFKSPWRVQDSTLNAVCNKNYLGRAFPMRAQQGTGTIKQEDRHEHEGKGQRHRIGICRQLLLKSGDPPPRDDDRSHQDANDLAAMRFGSDTIINRPWQGRQLFQAATRGHVR